MQWTDENKGIFQAFDNESYNILVNAAPGSGKTTVQCELWNRSSSEAIIALAFNKNIAVELTQRLKVKPNSEVRTFNSLGHSICKNTWPKVQFNANKLWRYIKEIEHLMPEKNRQQYKNDLYKLVGYMKNTPIEIYTDSQVQDVIDFYDIDSYGDIVTHAHRVYRHSIADTSVIDYADQLLFPVLYQLKSPWYELALIDECQDVNAVQIALLQLLQARNASIRVIAVGDSHQAIYAFRGALHDSMDVLGGQFHTTSFPLTTSFRCAREIVRKAQQCYPDDIHAAQSAIEGVVRFIEINKYENRKLKPVERDYNKVIQHEIFSTNDMVLCRTTAPLVAFAFQLLGNNIPCHIRGRDIGASLCSYVEKSGCIYINDFMAYVESDLENKIEIAQMKWQLNKIQSLQDRLEMYGIFAEACKSIYVSDMLLHIHALFDNGKGITLSTIHKAKGLEANKVFILAPDLMPHYLAKQDWELIQERNIEYVAITRAKEELVYI